MYSFRIINDLRKNANILIDIVKLPLPFSLFFHLFVLSISYVCHVPVYLLRDPGHWHPHRHININNVDLFTFVLYSEYTLLKNNKLKFSMVAIVIVNYVFRLTPKCLCSIKRWQIFMFPFLSLSLFLLLTHIVLTNWSK